MKTCFVISPIGDEGSETREYADLVLDQLITPALSPDYNVLRSDKISEPGLIDHAIFSRLISSDLVIADLTDHNPNVFYELAVRHCLGTPVIHIIRREERIPFDIRGFRTILVDIYDASSLQKAREEIRKQASSLAGGKQIVTPVTQFPETLSALMFLSADYFCKNGTSYDLSETQIHETTLSFSERVISYLTLYQSKAHVVDLSNKELKHLDACLLSAERLYVCNSLVLHIVPYPILSATCILASSG